MSAPLRIGSCALSVCLLMLTATDSAATERPVPTSERSLEVAARVEPELREAFAARGLTWGAPVFIRAFKESAELELWVETTDGFELFRTYAICAQSGGLGPKLAEGDHQVPEGFYFVGPSQLNPNSSWHLAMNIGFPNAYDRGLERTGSYIMIHGACGSSGCLAMTDGLVEEIYTISSAALAGGAPIVRVHIFPFRMTDDAMAAHADSEWLPFWANLREGYDWFEREGRPPNVNVDDARYTFDHAE